MLLCDDEPSPVSSDEVFFICEKQLTSLDRQESRDGGGGGDADDDDDEDDDEDGENDSDSAAKSDGEDSKHRTRGEKKNSEDTNLKKSVREAESQTAHTILVKIQVENCSQCPDNNKSISLFSHEPQGTNKDNSCKKKKTVAVQVNFNSIESVVESHCVKISKVRCCNKASLLQSVAKANKKSNNPESVEKSDNNKSADSTKIYLWSGKSAKKKSSLKGGSGGGSGGGSAVSIEKPKSTLKPAPKAPPKAPPKPPPKVPPTIQEPPSGKSSTDKGSIKCKKSPVAGCSPLKKLNRSSLTIEPDKITINLSKYSPCASRLAASSKILSSNSPLSPDSPLHGVATRSPRRIEHVQSVDRVPNKQPEKMTLQASLSLNIHQFQKTHPTPRSRSVGDSCVTSPTSEATTLSYSPTGTEILSLEEVGGGSSHEPSIFVLPPPEINDIFNDDYSACLRKANLETKC